MTLSKTAKRYGGKKGKKYPHLQRAAVRNCSVCGKEFRAIKDHKNYKQKRCSKDCYAQFWIENVRPKMAINPGLKGDSNPSWKGENAGYDALHKWIVRESGKPQECWFCKDKSKRKYEWASIGHEYKRDVSNWIRVCTPCHRKIDYADAILNQKCQEIVCQIIEKKS